LIVSIGAWLKQWLRRSIQGLEQWATRVHH
jgi:hypothetical protein